MIRVILVDDHAILREGVRHILEESGDITVVGEAGDSSTALKLIKAHQPDVAVVDITMPGKDGIALTEELVESFPALKILVLSMHKEPIFVTRILEAGAKGYVTKESVSESLVKAVKKIHVGASFLDESASAALATNLRVGKANPAGIDVLTARELQILCHLAMGQTNQEISATYNISSGTVASHRKRILLKLNLTTNAELVRFAIRNKIIEL